MSIEQAVENVVGGMDLVLVPCTDERNRNVLRTTAFRLRKRLEQNKSLKKAARSVGITKVEIDGQLFLKIYSRKELQLYTLDEDGELVELVDSKKAHSEDLAILKKMLKDKISDTEIFEIMTGPYKWSESDILEELAKEEELVQDIEEKPLIPQDVEKREKLNLEDL